MPIGVTDTLIRKFENQYPVPEGITYNSWLLEGGKGEDAELTVMDSVDSTYVRVWLENLERALAGRKPQRLVVLHAEPDHAGGVVEFLKRYQEAELVATAKCISILANFASEEDAALLQARSVAVGDGAEVEVGGGRVLRFLTAPMVHWPEVAVALELKDGTLFSADAFGTFGPGGFTSEDPDAWSIEGARYYFNICGRYGAQVTALLRKVAAQNVKRLLPLHGPVIENPGPWVELYSRWAAYEPDAPKSVMIAVASVYGFTLEAAFALSERLALRNVTAEVVDLARTDVSYAVAKAFRAGILVCAASSYDADVFPPMSTFLHHLELKGLRGRKYALIQNGSWGPTAARAMQASIDKLKGMEQVAEPLTVRSRMHSGDFEALDALADTLAKC